MLRPDPFDHWATKSIDPNNTFFGRHVQAKILSGLSCHPALLVDGLEGRSGVMSVLIQIRQLLG
jgi:hypothetical protein